MFAICFTTHSLFLAIVLYVCCIVDVLMERTPSFDDVTCQHHLSFSLRKLNSVANSLPFFDIGFDTSDVDGSITDSIKKRARSSKKIAVVVSRKECESFEDMYSVL